GNDRIQDIAAMVKVRKHMSDAEWKGYRSQIVDTAPKERQAELNDRLTAADKQYKDSQQALREEIKKLGANPDAKVDPDIVLQASNAAYAKQLVEVQNARVRRRDALAALQADSANPSLKD